MLLVIGPGWRDDQNALDQLFNSNFPVTSCFHFWLSNCFNFFIFLRPQPIRAMTVKSDDSLYHKYVDVEFCSRKLDVWNSEVNLRKAKWKTELGHLNKIRKVKITLTCYFSPGNISYHFYINVFPYKAYKPITYLFSSRYMMVKAVGYQHIIVVRSPYCPHTHLAFH